MLIEFLRKLIPAASAALLRRHGISVGLTAATSVILFQGLVNAAIAADPPEKANNKDVIWQRAVKNAVHLTSPCPGIGRDGSVYIGSTDGILYALKPDGSEMWRFNTGGGIQTDVAVDDHGTVYVGSNALYALGSNGTLKWKIPSRRFEVSSVAIGAGDRIYFMRDGSLCAADSKGDILWERDTWGHHWYPPIVGSHGMIYVDGYKQGSTISRIHAFGDDGTLRWTFEMDKLPQRTPLAVGENDTVYFGAGSQLYALNNDGRVKWVFKADMAIWETPSVAKDHTIYFGSKDTNLYALTPNGELKWKFATKGPIASSPAIDSQGNIYFTSRDGNFYCLNADGAPTRVIQLRNPRFGTPIIGPDGIIYVSDLNCVYAIRGSIAPGTGPWPMKRHDAQGTGRAGSSDTSVADATPSLIEASSSARWNRPDSK